MSVREGQSAISDQFFAVGDGCGGVWAGDGGTELAHLRHSGHHVSRCSLGQTSQQMWCIPGESDEVTGDEVDGLVDRAGAYFPRDEVEVMQCARGMWANHLRFSACPFQRQHQGAHIPGPVGFIEDSLGPLRVAIPRTLVVALDLHWCAPFGEEASGRKVQRGTELGESIDGWVTESLFDFRQRLLR